LPDRAFSRLVRQHHAPLVAHVRGSVGADAEDIAQETWLRAGEAVRGGTIANVRAYLFRIAGNLSIDHLRRRKVRAHLEAGSVDSVQALAVASPGLSPEQQLVRREREATFEAALAQLPHRARRVLLLSRVEGWAYPRIAAHLGISLRTVSNDLERALGACIALLADDDG
jgi:RNA polymerase sigma-70 factor (ECF subfamily)